jgi:hypothetical protein
MSVMFALLVYAVLIFVCGYVAATASTPRAFLGGMSGLLIVIIAFVGCLFMLAPV